MKCLMVRGMIGYHATQAERLKISKIYVPLVKWI